MNNLSSRAYIIQDLNICETTRVVLSLNTTQISPPSYSWILFRVIHKSLPILLIWNIFVPNSRKKKRVNDKLSQTIFGCFSKLWRGGSWDIFNLKPTTEFTDKKQ